MLCVRCKSGDDFCGEGIGKVTDHADFRTKGPSFAIHIEKVFVDDLKSRALCCANSPDLSKQIVLFDHKKRKFRRLSGKQFVGQRSAPWTNFDKSIALRGFCVIERRSHDTLDDLFVFQKMLPKGAAFIETHEI